MKVEVAKEIGEHCITLTQGERLFELIYPELAAGRSVEVDFQGVRVFASPFFNAGIGQLIKDIPTTTLEKLLIVRALSPAGTSTLRKVIENSQEYFRSVDTKRAVDSVVDHNSKSDE
jgi:hypothetical protein